MKTGKIAFYFLLSVLFFSSCQKEYSVEGGRGFAQKGTWEFRDGGTLFQGNMDTAFISNPGSTPELHLIGKSLDGTQTFNLVLYASNFATGIYKASLFQTTFDYASAANQLYRANQLIGEFVVTITSFSNNQISGSFSGSALDASGNDVQLTQGKFSSPIIMAGGGAISEGTLGDDAGLCKPVTLNGTYTPGTALDGSNTAELSVVVTKIGSYSISSNIVNGVTFSASGNFSTTGQQTVTLIGSGTPASGGGFDYAITYGSSQCGFSVIYGTAAIGTLGGGGGNCTPFTLKGTYQQGILFSPFNSVEIQVNVTSVGNYSITTNSVNGVFFTATGTFLATGVQSVTLLGMGTPTSSGKHTFTLAFGGSSCSFDITFMPGVAPSGDYFPVTINSNWVYSLVGGTSSDSLASVVINYSPNIIGNTYSTITSDYVPASGVPDSSYYRKAGSDYFQYINYSNYIPFDQPVDGEFIFLKDNVPAGTTWQSPNVSGSISGVPFSGYMKMTILASAVPVTIGTFNFPDVIKVKYEFFIAGSPTPLETDQRWFAKNTGEIHFDYDDGTNNASYDVGRYQIF
ncbi:MAG: hypothetical protein ABIO82_06230 [Ginsengibacter sp.]